MGYATLGSKSIGSTIKLKVNGAARNFIVVHQGKPSSIYDDSCNGTWILMQDVYTTSAFSSSESSYKASSIHSYLNGTFFNLIDADIRNAIKQVTIPYQNGGYGGNLATGASGLSTKVFLLSGYEVGFTTSSNSCFPKDGVRLAYFLDGTGTDAKNKRIAYSGSSASAWWLRSPYTGSTSDIWAVGTGGHYAYRSYSNAYGVRPALILPSTLLVSDDGSVSTNTAPSTPDSISVPSSIMGGTTITVSWGVSSDAEDNLAGYKVDRSSDGGSSWSQIYQGTETSTTNNVAFGTSSVMYRVKAYDDEGLESSYQTSVQVTVINNNAPTAPLSITVPTSVKGGDTLTISWTAASDSDGNLSGYVLERSTDGGDSYTQVYKGNALTYTDSITKGWMTVTYRVKAYDSYNVESGYATSASRTVDNNTAPTITTSSTADLGTKTSGFTVSYSVDDVDSADALTVTEELDNVVKRTYTPTRKATNSFAVTGEYFQKILNGKHALTISVTDGKETTTRTISFTKLVTSVNVTLSQPMDADAQITLCAVMVSGNIPSDAALKVEVTNNAKDSSPVWEDCTVESQNNRNHVFTNETAANGWSFNFRVAVKRGTSGGGYITSIQGGFQ